MTTAPASKLRAQYSPVDRERYWSILPGAIRPELEAQSPHNVTVEFEQVSPIGRDDEDGENLKIVDGIAMIEISGVLRRVPTLYERLFGGGGSYLAIERQVRDATENPAVRAIVLSIDSPGGTVAGGAGPTDAIFEARKVKPVIAIAPHLMASAAYRLGSQATEIYAGRDAEVGSIGTYAVIPDYSKMFEEVGIKIHVIRAGKFKGAGTPGTEITDEQIAEFQREVDAMNEVFLEEVSRGRSMSINRVRELADGRVHVGKAAQDEGLINGIGTIETAIDRANELTDQRVRDSMQRTLITQQLRRGGGVSRARAASAPTRTATRSTR